jgi:hypothetical protein
LHQGGQREHADTASDGEERDDGGECVHKERGIKSILQQKPDPARIAKHYYKINRIRQSIPQGVASIIPFQYPLALDNLK